MDKTSLTHLRTLGYDSSMSSAHKLLTYGKLDMEALKEIKKEIESNGPNRAFGGINTSASLLANKNLTPEGLHFLVTGSYMHGRASLLMSDKISTQTADYFFKNIQAFPSTVLEKLLSNPVVPERYREKFKQDTYSIHIKNACARGSSDIKYMSNLIESNSPKSFNSLSQNPNLNEKIMIQLLKQMEHKEKGTISNILNHKKVSIKVAETFVTISDTETILSMYASKGVRLLISQVTAGDKSCGNIPPEIMINLMKMEVGE